MESFLVTKLSSLQKWVDLLKDQPYIKKFVLNLLIRFYKLDYFITTEKSFLVLTEAHSKQTEAQ